MVKKALFYFSESSVGHFGRVSSVLYAPILSASFVRAWQDRGCPVLSALWSGTLWAMLCLFREGVKTFPGQSSSWRAGYALPAAQLRIESASLSQKIANRAHKLTLSSQLISLFFFLHMKLLLHRPFYVGSKIPMNEKISSLIQQESVS